MLSLSHFNLKRVIWLTHGRVSGALAYVEALWQARGRKKAAGARAHCRSEGHGHRGKGKGAAAKTAYPFSGPQEVQGSNTLARPVAAGI